MASLRNWTTQTEWMGPRGRGLLHTGAWSLLSRVCGAANLFVSVPFVLTALGQTQFGVWATLCSIVALSSFLDFGFGNGTMNLLASARARGDLDEIPRIVTAGFLAVSKIAFFFALFSAAAIFLIPWNRLLGLPESEGLISRVAVGIVLMTMTVGIPLNLGARIQLGLGQGNRAFRWQALGSLVSLCIVVLCAITKQSLLVLTAAAVTTPLLGSLINTFELWRNHAISRRNIVSDQATLILQEISRIGFKFFILQLCATLAFSTDLPLISSVIGPSQAATYAIVQRLFSIISMGMALLWVPLWPMYRHALAAGDHGWVARTFRNSLILAAVAATTGAGLLLFGFEDIIALWVHRPVHASSTLLIGFAVWSVLEALGSAVATLLNAAGIMRTQLVIAIVFVSLCLPLKFFGATLIGIEAVIWVTVTVYVCVNVVPLFLLREKLSGLLWRKPY